MKPETKNPLKKIAVVILNWNGAKLLEQFLPSVIAFSDEAAIYVADDLINEQATIGLFDPKVPYQQVLSDLDYLETRSSEENQKYIKSFENPWYINRYACMSLGVLQLFLTDASISLKKFSLNP